MTHELDMLFTLAGGLSAALVLGVLTQRLHLSPIVGYLLAGIAVGPFAAGFMVHGEIARQFSELGVILLMFGVGLKFDIHELLAVRKVVAPGALLQILISTGCGVALVHQVGWPLSRARSRKSQTGTAMSWRVPPRRAQCARGHRHCGDK